MSESQPALQVGDLVVLRQGAELPRYCHVAPGTVGCVTFVDDTGASTVSVQFAGYGHIVRLRPRDVIAVAAGPAVPQPTAATSAADAPLQVGDRVEMLAAVEQPNHQPAAPRRYGTVLEAEDENGRVAVEVHGRQHPLRLPVQQLRRVT